MSYQFTETPTFSTVSALPKYTQVIATSTEGQVDVAVAASTKVIGYTLNETFAAGGKTAVCLYEGRPRIGIASAAIAVGAFVEITASGQLVTSGGTTELVALSPAGAAGDYFTYCKCATKSI